jgi:hypothetical protein
MAINTHHTIEEINGVRCSVVEKKISAERAAFLKGILETNGYQVQIAETAGSVAIGVTDVVFSPLHALYARSLRTSDRKVITPAVWYQKQQGDGFYWDYK